MKKEYDQKKPRTGSSSVPVKIFIVDDHPIVRQGLVQLVKKEADLTVCGEAEDAQQALQAIEKSAPDLVIIDISLKEVSGIELIKNIRARNYSMPLLVLSMHDETIYAERVLRAGANGYIMKQEASEKVINAIRRILSGKIYVSDKVANKMLKKAINGRTAENESPIESLSDRELEVFHLIGKGHGTRQIAEKLYLSVKTIETYRAHLKEKLGLETAAELMQYAIQWINTEDSE